MKRIFIINPTLRVGGVERKIAEIARYLAQNQSSGMRADLFLEERLSEHSREDVFLNLVQQSLVHVHFKPDTRFVTFFLYLLYQVGRNKPDVILAFSRRPSVLALTICELVWWRKPRIIIGNDSIASKALALYVPHSLVRKVLAMQMRWLYPRVTRFLVPSDTSKRDLVENFCVPPEKISVLKNWTLPTLRQNVAKTFDLVYIGRVDPVKQLTRFIEIICKVREQLPSLCAVIVGDGNDMASVKSAMRNYDLEGNVSLVGFQTDIGSYLAQSKIFCLTSQFEGLPIAALEAMAYGLPVVTVAYAGATELVQSGETGFICANETEFCAAVVRLLTDEAARAEMGKNAQSFVEREHGEQVLEQYVDLVLNSD